ncbi:sulfotransferase [Oceaniglobus trochenteri]|uniref:sulfotransferase n=1 Tax=Oceaniglobus trochenteri TaxID=2763260 RepID=UPI001CFFF1D4|nr:sulfotransferase [Oceaniglobus trochenteri]
MNQAPDFAHIIMIGAMKSATTTLHQMLIRNPEIVDSVRKENDFFTGRDDVENYPEIFPIEPGVRYTLDSSTNYSKPASAFGLDDHEIPERIARLPRPVKLIYMMRHPIDRVESHIAHNIRQGRQIGREDQILLAIEVSRYATQLDRYRSFFEGDRMFLGGFDLFTNDRRAFMRNLYKFIDMPPLLEKLTMKRNVGVNREGLLTGQERRLVAERTLDDTRRLVTDYDFNPARAWVADLEQTLGE